LLTPQARSVFWSLYSWRCRERWTCSRAAFKSMSPHCSPAALRGPEPSPEGRVHEGVVGRVRVAAQPNDPSVPWASVDTRCRIICRVAASPGAPLGRGGGKGAGGG